MLPRRSIPCICLFFILANLLTTPSHSHFPSRTHSSANAKVYLDESFSYMHQQFTKMIKYFHSTTLPATAAACMAILFPLCLRKVIVRWKLLLCLFHRRINKAVKRVYSMRLPTKMHFPTCMRSSLLIEFAILTVAIHNKDNIRTLSALSVFSLKMLRKNTCNLHWLLLFWLLAA